MRPTFTIYRHVIFCLILFYEFKWGYEMQKDERNQYSAVKTFCRKKKETTGGTTCIELRLAADFNVVTVASFFCKGKQ